MRDDDIRHDDGAAAASRIRTDGGSVRATTEVSSPEDIPTDDSLTDRTLTAVTDATAAFRRADTRDGVARVAVTAVADAFEAEVACCHLYEPETNRLRRGAVTQAGDRLTTDVPGFDFGQTLAGRAFRAGEITHDAATDTCLSSESLAGTGVHTPVGDAGVLTVVLESGGAPGREVESCLCRLARVVATEFERVETQIARDDELDASVRERDHLEIARHVRATLHDATEAALDADTARGATAAAVRTLARADQFVSARVVEPAASGVETVAVADRDGEIAVEHVGTDDLSLDDDFVTTVATEAPLRCDSPDPAIYALRERADPDGKTIGCSLGGLDTADGAVVCTLADGAELVADAEAALDSFAETLGHVVAAKRIEELVTSDRIVRLEFEVTDRACLAVGISDTVESHCSVDRVVPEDDGTVLCYATVETGDEAAAVRAAEALDTTRSASVVESDETQTYLEVRRESSAANELIAAGGTARTATATDGVGTLVIDAPLSASLSSLIDRYTERTDATLVSKETVTPQATITGEVDTDEVGLTDRQREVVTAAHAAGYYAWPRERTAEQVAESLGISVSTLSEHLRTAHRKIVASFVE
ncbi:bacterio-opsin activator domain-containing protein, partial [Halobaculum sp. MBLA0147]|uniref:bacterio-opsin activator domain-containing protein n=1 Tax=Halobaculum sp. MBLA0147 TaxID=3079934 RepID=UPI003523B06C